MSLQQITANDILNLPANTVSNTQLVAGSVENYLSSQGSFITYRNRIQNGEMAVNQRANSNVTFTISGSSSGFNSVDRWGYYYYNLSGNFTPGISIKNTADHPIKGSNGKCLEIQCNANASPSINVDFFAMTHGVESQNISDIFSGSSAQPMTMTFWVKSNKPGIYCVELRDVQSGFGSVYIIKEYTIIQSGVWEKKVLSIPAPTFSAMPGDNSQGLYIQFLYASGLTPAYQAGVANSINAWANSYGTNGAASNNQTNLFSTAGNYHRLTDVQLESGSTATPFERRPYAVELQLCQRYLQSFNGQSFIGNPSGTNGNNMNPAWNFPIPMRASPTAGNVSGTLQSYTTYYATTSWSFSTNANAVTYLVTSNPSNPGYSSFLIAQMTTCLLSAEI